MVRKRKNKANKLARMSEEERIRYMQHRIEFELEAKRRKQQLIATFTKNKLKREEAFSKLNIAKINEKWRYVLRQIKCKELRENVKHLYETFDRVIRIKDATISCLHNELKVADADHRKLQETHIVLIDNIIEKYKQRLKELCDIYKFNDIKTNSIIGLTQLKNYIEQWYKEISKSITRKSISFGETQSTKKTQNAVNISSILYLEEDIASNLVHQSFLKIEDLWEQLCKVINEYQGMIENKKKQYEYLKAQDDICQIYILQYPKVHLQLQDIMRSLKVNTQILSEKRKEQITKLEIKDKNIKKKFKNMKYEFSVTQMIDSLQLKRLIIASNEVLKYLQKLEEKCSTIHETTKICSALEPLFFNRKKYFIQDTVYTEFADTDIPESCTKVSNFWKHYNHMKVSNILLKKEGNKLSTENKKLKCKLQAYFTTDSGILALYPVASPSV